MDNQDLQKQLEEQQKALAMIYKSVESTRKMILWSGIITAVTFIIPLIIAVAMLPKMINTLTEGIGVSDTQTTSSSFHSKNLSDTLQHLKNLGF